MPDPDESVADPSAPASADDTHDLTGATRELTAEVKQLGRHLTISARTTRRTQRLSLATSVVAIVEFLVIVALAVVVVGLQHTSASNAHNAKIQCQNSNDTRAAGAAVWLYLIDASEALNPNTPQSQKDQIAVLRNYVVAAYTPRDCAHLDQRVPVPSPPSLPRPTAS